MQMSKNKDATAFPDGDNLFEWVGTINGGKGTPYEGCSYKLKLKFGADYPYKAPIITFATAVNTVTVFAQSLRERSRTNGFRS